MTQTAQVTSILPDGHAEVSVQRKSACSNDCSQCAGCEMTLSKPVVTVTAENPIGAGPGDVVVVESDSQAVLNAAITVYLVPFALLFAGYALGQTLGLGEGLSILLSILGFGLGLLPARWLDGKVRRRKPLGYRIVEIVKPCSDI